MVLVILRTRKITIIGNHLNALLYIIGYEERRGLIAVALSSHRKTTVDSVASNPTGLCAAKVYSTQ
jgi:hypothetical protein